MISRSDILHVKSLSDKRSRDEHGLFVAEGMRLVEEILHSRFKVDAIYATEEGAYQLGRVSLPVEVVNNREMERISQFKTPSSVVAVVRKPAYSNAVPQPSKLTLVLDKIQDPGNMGTIIRLADWFGIDEIVCSPDCADCYAPKVVQATMGAITRVRIIYTDLCAYLSAAVKEGIPVYGTFLEGGNIYKESLTIDGIIVMGNEGNGISKEVSECITRKLYIPPYPADKQPTSESLNVAIATSVVCAEFRRRW